MSDELTDTDKAINALDGVMAKHGYQRTTGPGRGPQTTAGRDYCGCRLRGHLSGFAPHDAECERIAAIENAARVTAAPTVKQVVAALEAQEGHVYDVFELWVQGKRTTEQAAIAFLTALAAEAAA